MADLNDILSLTGATIRTAAKTGDKSLVIQWAHALTTGTVPSLPPYSWIHIGTSSIRTVATGSEDVQTSFRAAPRFDSAGTHYYVLALVDALTEDHGVGDAIAFYPQIIRSQKKIPATFKTSIGKPVVIDYRPYYTIAGPSTPVSIHSVPTAEFKLLTSPAGHVTVAPKKFPTGATLEAGSVAVTLQIYPGYDYYKALTIRLPLTGVPSDLVQTAPFPVINPVPGRAGRYVLRTFNYISDPDGARVTISGYFPTRTYPWLLPVRPSSQSVVFAWSDQSRIGQDIAARLTMTKAVPGFTPRDYMINIRPKANRRPIFVRAQPHRSVKAGTGTTIRVSGTFSDPDGDPLTLTLQSLNGRLIRVRLPTGTYSRSDIVTVPANGYIAVRGYADGNATLRLTATDNRGASARYDFRITVEDPPTTVYDLENPYEFDVTLATPFELNLDDYFNPNTPDGTLVYSFVFRVGLFNEEIIGNRLRINADHVVDSDISEAITIWGTNPRGARVSAHFNPTVLVPDIQTYPPLSANFIERMFRNYGVDAEIRDKDAKLIDKSARVILQESNSLRTLLDDKTDPLTYGYYNETQILTREVLPIDAVIHAFGTANTVITVNTKTARGHVLYYTASCERSALIVAPVQPSEDLQFGDTWEAPYAEVGRTFRYVSPRVLGSGITHTINGLPAGMIYDASTGVISGRPYGEDGGLSIGIDQRRAKNGVLTLGDFGQSNKAASTTITIPKVIEGTPTPGSTVTITLTATHTDGRTVQLSGDLVIADAGTLVPFALELGVAYRSFTSPEVSEMEKIGWYLSTGIDAIEIAGYYAFRGEGNNYEPILNIAHQKTRTDQGIDAFLMLVQYIGEKYFLGPATTYFDHEVAYIPNQTTITAEGFAPQPLISEDGERGAKIYMPVPREDTDKAGIRELKLVVGDTGDQLVKTVFGTWIAWGTKTPKVYGPVTPSPTSPDAPEFPAWSPANGTIDLPYETTHPPVAFVGRPFDAVPGYTYRAAGLGTGLIYNASTRTISGKPRRNPGRRAFTITATHTDGSTLTLVGVITVAASAVPIFEDWQPPDGFVGTAYTTTHPAVTYSGRPGDVVPGFLYDASGIGPGLDYDWQTRTIFGTPTGAGGDRTFLVRGTRHRPTTRVTLSRTISVSLVPVFGAWQPPDGGIGTAYTTTHPAVTFKTRPSSEVATGYTYTASGLGAGLTYNASTRTISGTPTGSTGNRTLVITATHTDGSTLTSSQTISVAAFLSTITSTSPSTHYFTGEYPSQTPVVTKVGYTIFALPVPHPLTGWTGVITGADSRGYSYWDHDGLNIGQIEKYDDGKTWHIVVTLTRDGETITMSGDVIVKLT